MTKKKIARHYERTANTTQRKCMCCQRMFASTWIGNRLCEPCKNDPYDIPSAEHARSCALPAPRVAR